VTQQVSIAKAKCESEEIEVLESSNKEVTISRSPVPSETKTKTTEVGLKVKEERHESAASQTCVVAKDVFQVQGRDGMGNREDAEQS
jgi:hypothetical protein